MIKSKKWSFKGSRVISKLSLILHCQKQDMGQDGLSLDPKTCHILFQYLPQIHQSSQGIGNNRGKSLTQLNIRWFIRAQWLRRRSQYLRPEGYCDSSTPRHGWGHGRGRVGNTALGLTGSRYLWPVRKPESENTSFTRSQSKCPKANPRCLMAVKVCMDLRVVKHCCLAKSKVTCEPTGQASLLSSIAQFPVKNATRQSPTLLQRVPEGEHAAHVNPLAHREMVLAMVLEQGLTRTSLLVSHTTKPPGGRRVLEAPQGCASCHNSTSRADPHRCFWSKHKALRKTSLLLVLGQKGRDNYLTHTIGEKAMRWFVRSFPTPQASFPAVSASRVPASQGLCTITQTPHALHLPITKSPEQMRNLKALVAECM